jgi:hypothetical protein
MIVVSTFFFSPGVVVQKWTATPIAVFCFFHQLAIEKYYAGYHIKDSVMGGACGTYGRRVTYRILAVKPEKNYL